MEVILSINDLKYSDLFENLNIYIEKNTITTISGPNNCGKTTLMKILDKMINKNFNINLYDKNYNEYSDKEFDELIQVIFPNNIMFQEKIIIQELNTQTDNIDNEKIEYIINNLNLKQISKKNIKDLTTKEIILTQIALAIINSKSIIIIDEIDNYFSKEEIKNLYKFLYECIEKYDLTFIISTLNLDSSIYTDYIYIINNGKVAVKGEPIKVLAKDNVLNKIGLEIPFMIDLSVKLKDYDLIDDIYKKEEELIEALWN